VPVSIICVECGGPAHLVSYVPPDEFFAPDDVVTYTCADCDHRLDVVVGDDASTDSPQDA